MARAIAAHWTHQPPFSSTDGAFTALSVDQICQCFAELLDPRALAPHRDGQRAEQGIAGLGSDPKFGKAAPCDPSGGENKLNADEGKRQADGDRPIGAAGPPPPRCAPGRDDRNPGKGQFTRTAGNVRKPADSAPGEGRDRENGIPQQRYKYKPQSAQTIRRAIEPNLASPRAHESR